MSNKLGKTHIIWQGKHEGPPVGISLKPGLSGDSIPFQTEGFHISDQGIVFHNLIDQIASVWIRPLMTERKIAGSLESSISEFLITIRPDGTYYLNMNFQSAVTAIINRSIKAGEAILQEDLVDISRISYPAIPIKEDDCVISFFSDCWRHGIYYNFKASHGEKFSVDKFEQDMARFHLELSHSECYISDSVTIKMAKDGWFPFLAISGMFFKQLYHQYHSDPLFPANGQSILDYFTADRLERLKNFCISRESIKPHAAFIESALRSYQAGDYIACINTLYTRIEGVMRFLYLPSQHKPHIPDLRAELKRRASAKFSEYSLSRHSAFDEYLRDHFFTGFDLATGQLDLSRVSVAHGVAPETAYTKSRALIGFLILNQIAHYCVQ